MTINVNKEELYQKLTLASHFTSTKLSSTSTLQGAFLVFEKNKLHIYSSNLSSFFHTTISIEGGEPKKVGVEVKKLLEFLGLLESGKVGVEIGEGKIVLSSQKARGTFPVLPAEDFPLPPKIGEKEQKIDVGFLEKNLPLVLFSASHDEGRPVLTGVNFLTNEELIMVSTDGFRLSYLKSKKDIQIPSVIVPGEFLSEVIHAAKGEKEMGFSYSEQEKMVYFSLGETQFFSRLIEGEFPPFEKVIPTETKTVATVDVDEFARNIKLASIFARDVSNIIVLEFSKNTLSIRPKIDTAQESSSRQEIEMTGEDQRVAFNYKFLLDFLSHVPAKKITIELLRSDAPVVFKLTTGSSFLHIIMPVRIQE